MKKTMIVSLVVMVLASGVYAREGAQLIVAKKDGQTFNVELLAVKHQLLVLKDSDSQLGLSVDIKDLESLQIKRRTNMLLGAGLGLVIGSVVGFAYGYHTIGGLGHMSDMNGAQKFNGSMNSIALGLAGAALGGLVAAATGEGGIFRPSERSQAEIEQILTRLRSEALYKAESY